jgi:hypothetical protein
MKSEKLSPRPSTKEKRWFVLEGHKLKHFKTAQLTALPLGVIDVSAAKVRKSRTKKKYFVVEIPVTHSNHGTNSNSASDAQQDPIGVRAATTTIRVSNADAQKKDVQKRKYFLKAANKAQLDLWVKHLTLVRGLNTLDLERNLETGSEATELDSDSESAMLTAVTEMSDSDEDSKSDDEDSKSESSDKIDALHGLNKKYATDAFVTT